MNTIIAMSALIREFNKYRSNVCTIAPIGKECLALLKTNQIFIKKQFDNSLDAEEYLWRNAAITFLPPVSQPAVIVELDTQRIIAASDAACDLLNLNLIGQNFTELIDGVVGMRLLEEIHKQGFGHAHLVFKTDQMNAIVTGECIFSPKTNSFGFFEITPG